MRQLLTPLLAFHWMAAFAVIAVVSTAGGDGGVLAAFGLMGAEADGPALPAWAGSAAAFLLAVGFSLVALLFLWTLADGVFGGGGAEISPLAFAAAIAMLTATMLYGATLPVTGLAPAITASLVALVLSYLTIAIERRLTAAKRREGETAQLSARLLAADAARGFMLSHIAGRLDLHHGERP